jgi:4-hydroxyproline epimerase
MQRRISVIDSHTGGEPTRVVTHGLAVGELEVWRRAIVAEPRGHEVMVGALLVPTQDPDCVSGVVFFNNVGLLGMCGHGLMGVVTTLHHLGRIGVGEHQFETPVGIVSATLQKDGRASVRNVRSYRLAKGVQVAGVRGDVAWGGNWFFLVADHEWELTLSNIPELTEKCIQLRSAIRAAGYPDVDHVELFGPPDDPSNDSRNFVLCPGSEYDRSPCGTGTSAKLACLAADGVLAPGQVWRQESIIGSVFEGSYESAEDGIHPTIVGRAFIVAESTLLFDEADPFLHGITVC